MKKRERKRKGWTPQKCGVEDVELVMASWVCLICLSREGRESHLLLVSYMRVVIIFPLSFLFLYYYYYFSFQIHSYSFLFLSFAFCVLLFFNLFFFFFLFVLYSVFVCFVFLWSIKKKRLIIWYPSSPMHFYFFIVT